MRILSVLLLCLVAFVPANAEDQVCPGTNLIEKSRTESPEEVAALEQAAAKVPYGKGLLWQVSKPGVEPSFLFGTMHLSDPRVASLNDTAQRAFDRSGTLALEITEILEPEKSAANAMKLMKYTTYLDGSSLEQKLDDEQIKIIKSTLRERMGLPWNVAQKIRPWVVMTTLALPACELKRKQEGKPFLDMALGLEARKQGKSLIGLETLESQMAMMASLPEKTMIEAIVDSAKLGDQLNDVFETMIQLYLKQDTGLVYTMMRHLGPNGLDTKSVVSGYADFQRVAVDQRNRTMAEESAKLIDKGGTFIAVGALHLPGANGILNILAQRGYTLTRQ